MFVQAEVRLGASRAVVALPASAISYAPYGDSVFVVDDLRPDGRRTAACASSSSSWGPEPRRPGRGPLRRDPGDEVVTSGVFKLRNGAPVHVNNTVQPANEAPEAGGQLMLMDSPISSSGDPSWRSSSAW
jgi:membrane fusion protein, multidrug efflux system